MGVPYVRFFMMGRKVAMKKIDIKYINLYTDLSAFEARPEEVIRQMKRNLILTKS